MMANDTKGLVRELSWSEWLKAYWPYITSVAVAAWAMVNLYVNHRADEKHRQFEALKQLQVRTLEAQRPFLDKQLQLYFETAKVAGQLVTLDRAIDAAAWTEAQKRYEALYWVELSMVENKVVEASMLSFRRALNVYMNNPAYKWQLENKSYCLAHAIRNSIRETWAVQTSAGAVPEAAFSRRDNAPNDGRPTEDRCNDPIQDK